MRQSEVSPSGGIVRFSYASIFSRKLVRLMFYYASIFSLRRIIAILSHIISAPHIISTNTPSGVERNSSSFHDSAGAQETITITITITITVTIAITITITIILIMIVMIMIINILIIVIIIIIITTTVMNTITTRSPTF